MHASPIDDCLSRGRSSFLDAPGELSPSPGSGCERPTAKKIVCRAAAGRFPYPDTLNALQTVTVKAAEPAADAGALTVTFAIDGRPALAANCWYAGDVVVACRFDQE